MPATAQRGKAASSVEEERLARGAAAGDGRAFAELYERYEKRAYNLAYRITGSEAVAADAVQEAFLNALRGLPGLTDSEPSFGSYLFAATRNACYELMPQRQRGRAGGPEDRGKDPDRDALSQSQQEIRNANMQLPERQREALALRELELSYEEIAAIMATSAHTVAELISRARINLQGELGGTALASVVAPSPECERALPLIAARDDGQLEAGSRDAAWLDAHLAGCDRCRLGVEVMREAGTSYRAWAPIAAVPWLFKETAAKAAELSGADWSEPSAEAAAASALAESRPGTPSAHPADRGRGKPSRRRTTLAVSLVALLLLAGLAAAFARDDPPATPADPTAGPGAGPRVGPARRARAKASKPRPKSGKAGKPKLSAAKTKAQAGTTSASSPSPAPLATEGEAPSEPASGPDPSPGQTAIQPTRQTAAPKPSPKPKSTSSPTPPPAPQPAPAPAVVEPAPIEEPSEKPKKNEPPGKPPDRPPR